MIDKKSNKRRFIPSPFKAVILISADFELAWAWQYAKSAHGKLDLAMEKARLERKNIPKLLKLCDEYSIPITWAMVGHLMLEGCNQKGFSHDDLPRLPFFENDFWKFCEGDWFQHDPKTNYKEAPEWFCPDLLRLILDAKTKHEIGCHTFSHIDCRDEICPPEIMQAELRECKHIAQRWGIELKSFVHPGFTVGNLNVLCAEKFTNFRTDYRNVLGYPKKHDDGLWEFEQTAEIFYRKDWSIDYQIYRYITIIKRAIRSNTVCVLWFHPSIDSIVVEEILPELFWFINKNKDKIWVTSNSEYVEWLEKRSISNY